MSPKIRPYRVLLHMPSDGLCLSWVVVNAFTAMGARTMAELSCDGAKAIHVVPATLDCQGIRHD